LRFGPQRAHSEAEPPWEVDHEQYQNSVGSSPGALPGLCSASG
jgi:hypothetical protein